jgi:peptidase M28-like protein
MARPQTAENSKAQSVTHFPGTGARLASIIVLFLALIAGLAIYLQNRLPKALPESASLSEFSAGRALRYLQTIGARPHPLGSQEHLSVRDYIFRELSNLGLNPEMQKATAVNKRSGPPFSAGAVENIMARIKGTESSRAFLLVCHYDSVPTSPGASDDGAGVVTLLETARALKAGPPLKNDVILLFTDGEEVGLLGADAFVAEHPWSRDVGVFLNFEARGNSGPVLMFETTEANGDLIRQFGNAAPRPLASSFFYEIYKLLPNDTDFTVLKRMDAQGMNFAFVNGINHYHTKLDNLKEINQGSLQHEGSYALALTRHFGNLDLNKPKAGNSVYFNVIGATFVNYPGALTIPLSVFTVLLFAFLVVRGFRKKDLTVFGIVWGGLGLVASVIASATIVWLLWRLVLAIRQSYRWVPWGEPYHSNTFRLGFVLLALAATLAIFILLGKKVSARNLVVGSSLCWLLSSVWVSVALPGGSYLFTLPLLFSLFGLILISFPRFQGNRNFQILFGLSVVPGVVLWAPMIYNLFVALTLNASWIVIVFVVLIFAVVVQAMLPIITSGRWLFPAVLTLASLGLILAGIFLSGFDSRRPKMNNIFYAVNADTGKAVFASSDDRPDEWTAQFLTTGLERGTMTEYFPGNTRTYLKSPAPAAQLVGPNAILVSDRIENGVRTLNLHVSSQRHAPVVSIYAEADVEILEASINGKQAMRNIKNNPTQSAPTKNWGLQFFNLSAEGADLMLKTKSEKPFNVLIVDRSYELPNIPGMRVRERSDDMIPAPYSASDVTLVAKSFTF